MSERKKKSRFLSFTRNHRNYFGEALSGPMLEYGCGAGDFLIEAHENNIACHGVEVSNVRKSEFERRVPAHKKAELDNFFHLYDGELLPFGSRYFSSVYSWFVMEHVGHVWTSLREIVRVLKPGGTIFITTQDARGCYDGHADKPWPAFLPASLIPPYLDEIGYDSEYIKYISEEVFYVTTPQMSSVLASLGCEIVYQSADPPRRYTEANDISTEAEVRAFARRVVAMVEADEWERPTEHSTIYARKKI